MLVSVIMGSGFLIYRKTNIYIILKIKAMRVVFRFVECR